MPLKKIVLYRELGCDLLLKYTFFMRTVVQTAGCMEAGNKMFPGCGAGGRESVG